MTDLNSDIIPNSGWTLQDAQAINDAGQITGSGLINGHSHAFLLNPVASSVPEPATFAARPGFLRLVRRPAQTLPPGQGRRWSALTGRAVQTLNALDRTAWQVNLLRDFGLQDLDGTASENLKSTRRRFQILSGVDARCERCSSRV